MKENEMKKSLISVFLIFFGTLILLTISRMIAGTNSYIYFIIPFVWFLGLFIREITTKKEMLSSQWAEFKKRKWLNILYVVLTLVLITITPMVSRPFFNQFIPSHPAVSYDYSNDTVIGLLFLVLSGLLDLIVAFVEEVTYRYEGMYAYKSNKLLLGIMVIVSSILFGFSHYYNFGGSFLATGPYVLAGFVLAIAYLVSKNIWVPVFAHLIFNSSAILASLFLIVVKIIS